jgi:uncharacterized repeat protein (TIGR01451 family)
VDPEDRVSWHDARTKLTSSTGRARALGIAAVTATALAAAVVLAIAVPFATAVHSCTITWDGGAGTTAWGTGNNWDTNAIPGVTDHVCIPDGATVVHSTGTTSILSLQSLAGATTGLLTLSGGTLTLTSTDPHEASTAVDFTQTGGILDGAATLVVSGDLVFNSGTQTSTTTGQTTVAATGTLAIGTASTKTLTGARTLRNEGTATWSDGNLTVGGTSSTARLENAGTFTITGDDTMSGSGTPLLHNEATGTLAKNVATGVTTISIPVENDGTIAGSTGTLNLNGGGPESNGAFGANDISASVNFNLGAFTLGTGASFTGRAGITGSATVNVDGTVTGTGSSTLTHSGGTLQGTGTLTTSGAYAWTGGTQGGTGQTTITPTGTLAIGTASTKTLTGARTLRNEGTATWSDGNLTVGGTSSTARLENAGTFTITGDDTMSGSGTPLLHNEATGTLAKNGGTGTSTISIPADNDGTIEASAGTVNLIGALANWSAGTQTLTGGRWVVSATLGFSGADVVTNAADIELDGAAWVFTNTIGQGALRNLAVNAAAGSLEIRNLSTLTTSGAFANSGEVVVGLGSTLTSTGSYTQAGGSTSLASFTSALTAAGASVQVNGGTLAGIGTAGPSVTVNGGTVSPGLSPGILGVNGPLTLRATGATAIEIGGLSPGTQHDQIQASEAITLGGTLAITTLPGFTPAEGQSFTIMTGSSVTGTFTDVTGDDLPGDLRYVVQTTPTAVILNVASRTLSIADASTSEGDNATFTVTLDPPDPANTVTVDFSTSAGSATSGVDFTGQTGTLTFTPNDTTETITVSTVEDAVDEDDETFTVTLSGAAGASIGDGTAAGTILDDDASPQLSVDDDSVTEGDAGTVAATFTVSLSAASGRTVTVAADVQDGTATIADDDYQDASETVTLAPGQLATTFTVLVNGDVIDEPDETFDVVLSNPTNATIAAGGSPATGTILNDDAGGAVDLQIFKTDSPDPVATGGTLTYDVSVFSSDPDNATDVVVTDDLPTGLTLVSATPSAGGTCNSADPVVCTWPVFEGFGFETVEIVASAPGTPTTLTNTATVTSDTPDPVPTNNSATVDTDVVSASADLSVSKSDQFDPVAVGDELAYSIVVSNSGPTAATGVTVTDTLPAGTTFLSATPTQGTCGQAAGVVTCDLGTMSAFSGEFIDLRVTAPGTVGDITNEVTVAANEPDPDPVDNDATQTTSIVPVSADLSVAKNDFVDPVLLGGDVSYTITVSNSGPYAATGVSLVDDLPDGVTFVSSSPSAPTCSESAGTVTCALGSLARGASTNVIVTVTAPNAATDLTNTATVSATAPADPNTANNTDSETTLVRPPCFPGVCIDNGTVLLAVNPEGHLNVTDANGSPAGPGDAGLHFIPTGNDATSPGCLCEGWGAADAGSGVSGYANVSSDGGANNMTLESFTTTPSTAVSVVNIQNTLRVTHDYHPAAGVPNLYEATVTIQNVTAGSLSDIRYRRVMDWDIEPTAFSEFVTIEGGNAANLQFDSNDGFASANPLSTRSNLGSTGDFTDVGPSDHGALFDFGFGALAAEQSVTFRIFYGATPTETAALEAINAVDAEVYSLGQPSTPDGPTLGTPNTFVFAFRNVGGTPIFSPDAVDDTIFAQRDEPGSVNVLANDTDPQLDPLTVTEFTQGANGDVTCTPAGLCTYTPDPGFTGGDSFTYTVTDGNGGFDTATVTVTVNAPPTVAVGADTTIAEGSLFTRAGSFTDPDAQTWTGTVNYGDGTGPQTLALNADKTFTLSHAYADNGTFTATVTISDGTTTGSDSFLVTVTNVDPVVSAGPDAALATGGTFAQSGSFTDPGADTWTGTVDYGDGGGPQALTLNPDKTFDLSHVYATGGTHTVTVTVTDDDGGSSSDTVTVTVNTPPTVSAGADATVSEGSLFTRGGSFTDPDTQTWTATVDYGDGGGPQALALNPDKTFTLSHTYADDDGGPFTVTVTVNDGVTTGTDTFEVDVDNAAPVVAAGPDATIAPGGTFSSSGSFTDPGADTWTGTVNYGDGSGDQTLTLNPDKTFDLAHVYATSGTYTVTVTVADDDGGQGSDTVTVTVNTPPTVSAGADATVAEGSLFTQGGSFTDPNTQTWTATVNYGDGTGTQALALNPDKTFTFSHTYADDDGGPFTVTVTVSDGSASGSDTLLVTVTNVDPVVDAGPDDAIVAGDTFSSAGSFTDPATDTWTGTVDYGDGSGPQALTLNPDKTFALAHAYATAGTYTVTVTVTDDDGGAGSDTATVTVTADNTAPTVSAGDDATVAEGSLFTGGGSFTDPDAAQPWTATVNYGDGTGTSPLALNPDKTFTLSHTYADDDGGPFTVTVTVDDGITSDSDTLVVTVTNTPPTVDAGPDDTITSGGTFTSSGSFTDPGAVDTWTGTVDYGDGSGPQTLTLNPDKTFALSHVYAAPGTFTVTVTVADDDGGQGTDTTTVTVEAPATFTLDVALAGTGTGQVTGPGLACPPDCTETYTEGTEVTLEADPAGDSTFTGWAGDCTGTGDCTVTMSEDRDVTATFDLTSPNHIPYAVDDYVNPHGTGPEQVLVLLNDTDIDGDELTISAFDSLGGKVTCGTTTCTYTHDKNEAIQGIRFRYTVSDGRGGSAQATVHVRVRRNTAPEARDDVASAHGSGGEPIAVLFNDSDAEGDQLTPTPVDPDTDHGTVMCPDSARRCVYTADAGFLGTDTFEYRIDDGHGGSDTATVEVTVGPNVPPTAVDDKAIAHGNGDLLISVLANDLDPEVDPLSIVGHTDPPAGFGTVACPDRCTYTPPIVPPGGPRDYPFTTTFTYTIDDGHGGTSTPATVDVEVRANQAPRAVDDAMTAPALEPGFALPGIVAPLGNDIDGDGDVLDILPAPDGWTNGANGTVACFPPNQSSPWTCHYTADPGFAGTDTFQYTITDDHGDCATQLQPTPCDLVGTVTVRVLPNHDPVARNDTVVAHGTGAEDLYVLANDTDPDDDELHVLSHTQPTLGTVECAGDCRYTPPSGFTGPYPQNLSFTYTVGDGRGGESGPATVSIRLVANHRPVIRDDRGTAGFLRPARIFVLSNDFDADDDGLTITSFSQPSPKQGVVVCGDGVCTYRAPAGFFGTVTFTYTASDGHGDCATDPTPGPCDLTGTVTVRVTQNLAPIAGPDEVTASTRTNTQFQLLLANDSDPDGDDIRIITWTDPTLGTLDCSSTSCVYRPDEGLTGPFPRIDTFRYEITDDHGGYAEAEVTVTVQENRPPTALDDELGLVNTENGWINVVGNDDDPDDDPLQVLSHTQAEHGTVQCRKSPPNTLPFTHCSYTLDPAYSGPFPVADEFTYVVTDGRSGTDVGTVEVTVRANSPPVAVPDTVTARGKARLALNLLANDTDADGDQLEIVAVSSDRIGCGLGGSITDFRCFYTPPDPPPAGYPFDDTFTYTIWDGQEGHTSTATVVVHVVANSAPVANPDSGHARSGHEVLVPVLANDTDADDDIITIRAFTSAANGTVACPSKYPFTAACSYTSNAGFTGLDSFTYTITDGQGNDAVGTVSIDVGPENHPVEAHDDVLDVFGVEPHDISVLSNDTDADFDLLRVVGFDPQAPTPTTGGGSVSCDTAVVRFGERGFVQCRYTPPAGFGGPFPLLDSFTYEVSDGRTSDIAAVSVTVHDNRSPVACNDGTPGHVPHEDCAPFEIVMHADVQPPLEPVIQPLNVLKNDFDPDGDEITGLVANTTGTLGAVSCSVGTGYCDYTPPLGFAGTDSFTYTITDDRGATSGPATVEILVKGNGSPDARDDEENISGPGLYVFNVRANDRDPDGDFLTVGDTVVTPPDASDGVASCFAEGCSFTPAPTFDGSAKFQYRVFDGHGGQDEAWVIIGSPGNAVVLVDLTSAPNPSAFGQAVTFSASVTAPGLGLPTGTVELREGATILDSTPVASGTAQLSLATLAVGTHSITAHYVGDGSFAGSAGASDPVAQTVFPADTTTTLTSTPNPSAVGQSVTFTATVAPVPPGAGTPTGTVRFAEGPTTLATSTLAANGTATFTTSALTAGSHDITAHFEGTTSFTASSSAAHSHTVSAAPTATLAIGNASVTEGDSGTAALVFTVTKTGAAVPASASFATSDGTATAGSDYTAAAGTVTFAAADTTMTVTVLVSGDAVHEADETLLVTLSDPVGATISGAPGTGTIENDDAQPTLSVDDVSVTEGDTGTTDLTFTVTKSGQTALPAGAQFSTEDGTATAAFADAQPGSGFVTRTGDQLFLDGAPYRFSGINIYNANSNGLCWFALDGTLLDDSLAAIGPGGKGVVRAWFFQQLATSGGARDWTAFDRTLNTMRARGYKVIATLIDQWGNCGSLNPAGAFKDEAWYTTGYTQVDPVGTVSYRDWVAEVVDRYKNDPAVLAWEPVNEPEMRISENGGCSMNAGAKLQAFMTDVTGLIKSIDSNHLVSSGVIGSGQCGAQFTDYAALHTISTIDLCSFHDYGAPLAPMPGDQFNGLQFRLDQCEALGKPLIVGEAGITPNDIGGTFTARRDAFRAKLMRQIPAGVAGFVPWAWNKDNSTLETFDIGPGDPVLPLLAGFGDYETAAGTLTFAPGDTTKTITVTVLGDLLDETDETMLAKLANATGATIADGTGTGTIVDDDGEPALSVGDASVTEGNAGTTTMTFDVTLGAPSGKTVTVGYATTPGTAAAGSDYDSASGTVTFEPGQVAKTVTVTVHGDAVYEADESLSLGLSGASNATVADGTGAGAITNDDGPPTLAIDDVSHAEGDAGTTAFTFTVTKTGATELPATVDFDTADGTATAPDDYTVTAGTLTFEPSQTERTLTVLVEGDTTFEPDEAFTVTLTSPAGATILEGEATGTILNDDPQLSGTIQFLGAGSAHNEAAVISVNVTRSGGSQGAAQVTVTTDSSGTATGGASCTAGVDFINIDTTLSWADGETGLKSTTLQYCSDADVEPDETVNVVLSNPTGGATLGTPSTATYTILNDDAQAATISIQDVDVVEGDAGTTPAGFVVTLSQASASPVTVDFASASGTATAPGDYATTSGTVTFVPGDLAETITIGVAGDTTYEADETFGVALSNATGGATIEDGSATGTIQNDDTPPSLSIGDVSQAEGNAGTTAFSFTVTKTGATELPASVDLATSNGTATAGSDYTATTGTVTFAAGDTNQTFTVNVSGDTVFEAAEAFTASLSNPSGATVADGSATATIQNDDTPPSLSIGDVSQAEGNAGTTAFTFTVTKTGATQLPASVDLATSNGTATAGSDYTATTGTVTFAAGDTNQTFTVNVSGDTVLEPDETFVVTLSNASGATIGDGSATATITNDEPNATPVVSAGPDATVAEGSPFTRGGSFTDPDAQSWTATVDYGDGGGAQTLALTPAKTFQLSHVYADNGTYTVTVRVSDGLTTGVDTVSISVGNVAPTVNAGPDAKLFTGTTFTSSGSFTDPGGADTHTATVDYDDGSGPQALALNPDGTFALVHAYLSPGTYTVTVTVTDDDGGTATDTVKVKQSGGKGPKGGSATAVAI